MKDSFILYTKYSEHINLLTLPQRGVLLTAIMSYAAGETLPDMDAVTAMAFSFIKSDLDRDAEKYRQAIETRREAGKQGGRPKRKENVTLTDNDVPEKDVAEKANGFSENHMVFEKTNGFSEKQMVFEKPDNEYVYEYDNDNDSIKEKNIKKEKFIPPTVEEVKDYVAEKGYSVDAEKFVAFYASKGWMIGKNKMKSWRQAVVTWEKNNRDQAQARSRPERTGNTGNKFNNFPQRKYDFEELEKQLLAVQRS